VNMDKLGAVPGNLLDGCQMHTKLGGVVAVAARSAIGRVTYQT